MNSRKFLQISVGVSTQYDDRVMANVEAHQLALRSEILGTMIIAITVGPKGTP